MPMNTVKLVIDSRDRIGGTAKNNARYQIHWDRVIPYNNIKKINVRADFKTKGAFYHSTDNGAGGAITVFLASCVVKLNFNSGNLNHGTGDYSTPNSTFFTAQRYDNEMFSYQSNESVLQLENAPTGLTQVSIYRTGTDSFLCKNVADGTNAAQDTDMDDYSLILYFDVELYPSGIRTVSYTHLTLPTKRIV